MGGLSSNVTLDSAWAEKNEDAIVNALAISLSVNAHQIQIVSISRGDAALRRLQAGETQSSSFRIHFTVDVVQDEAIAQIKNVMENFVDAGSGVQETFITELQSELKSRDAPVPGQLSALRAQSTSSEVWLRGSTYFESSTEQDVASWLVGAWGPCEGSCGTSFQNRSVECSAEDPIFCIAPKPPSFRECRHRNPCPDPKQTCNFGCSPGWWIFFAVLLVSILICICTCLRIGSRRLWRGCGKPEGSEKMNALESVTAYVKSQGNKSMKPQANHSMKSDVQATSIDPEAPTLLQSLPQEQGKLTDLQPSLSVPKVVQDLSSDMEVGIALPSLSVAEIELQHQKDPSPGSVSDLVQWVANVDTKHLKGGAIPAGGKTEVGDSQV